jgi:hypothetical protein
MFPLLFGNKTKQAKQNKTKKKRQKKRQLKTKQTKELNRRNSLMKKTSSKHTQTVLCIS